MRKNIYAPDDSGQWEKIGPATKKNWPKGIPAFLTWKENGKTFQAQLKEYAGYVWKKAVEVSPDE